MSRTARNTSTAFQRIVDKHLRNTITKNELNRNSFRIDTTTKIIKIRRRHRWALRGRVLKTYTDQEKKSLCRLN
jgi:hypothetical protein